MKIEGFTLFKTDGIFNRAQGADLNVFPSLSRETSLKEVEEVVQFFLAVDQGLAMIGKGQRYQSATSQPTIDAAENQAIG